MTIQCSQIDNLLLEGDPQSLAVAAEHAQTWNNDMLWPRIERAIARDRRRRWSVVLQIAAALLLFAFIGTVVWRVQRRTEFDRRIMTMDAVSEVDRAQQQFVAAIDHLEKIADAKLENPTTPLMVNYKEKLMLLDDAIAECQTNIERNRNNAQLRTQLLAIYSEKQRTLQDVLREESHVNP
jgi:hypothetical protein